jgi:hypothetical protein
MTPPRKSARREHATPSSSSRLLSPNGVTPLMERRPRKSYSRRTPMSAKLAKARRRREARERQRDYDEANEMEAFDCDMFCCLDLCCCGWWMRPLGRMLTKAIVGWLVLCSALPCLWYAAANEMQGLVGSIFTFGIIVSDVAFITGCILALGTERLEALSEKPVAAIAAICVGFFLLLMRQPVGIVCQAFGLFAEELRELPWREYALRLQLSQQVKESRVLASPRAKSLIERASGFTESGV